MLGPVGTVAQPAINANGNITQRYVLEIFMVRFARFVIAAELVVEAILSPIHRDIP